MTSPILNPLVMILTFLLSQLKQSNYLPAMYRQSETDHPGRLISSTSTCHYWATAGSAHDHYVHLVQLLQSMPNKHCVCHTLFSNKQSHKKSPLPTNSSHQWRLQIHRFNEEIQDLTFCENVGISTKTDKML